MSTSRGTAQWRLDEIARIVDGVVRGEPATLVTGVASIEEAEPGEIVFAETARFRDTALKSRAAAVLLSQELATDLAVDKPLVLVPDARQAFVTLLETLAVRPVLIGIDPTAHVDPSARVGNDVFVGSTAYIGPDAEIGDGVAVHAGAYVGEGCRIGAGSLLYPNVVLYAGARVGRRCILHAGCVIGADGFGYVAVGMQLRKIPHLGSVELGDDVEVGANACIDRARTGVTSIGPGTKLDNLVHVAHNVRIGASCVLVAQVGIAGSTEIGNGVTFGGQSGAKDHVSIGDGARVAARGGVIGDVSAGETVSGFPARPHRAKMREFAAIAALPAALKRIRDLEARLEALERSR